MRLSFYPIQTLRASDHPNWLPIDQTGLVMNPRLPVFEDAGFTRVEGAFGSSQHSLLSVLDR